MHTTQSYSGQFALTPDLFHVTIPQWEIIVRMAEQGEAQTLNDICLTVAVVADAISAAMGQPTA